MEDSKGHMRRGDLTARLAGALAAGLHVGGQVDPAQSGSWLARVEQPASGHVSVRHTAGWGAGVTASGLEEADVVWAGAGQADSTAAAFVRGADGGGGAGGDAAAAGNAASHGVGTRVFVGLRREVSWCHSAGPFCSGSYIPTSLGVSL